MKYLIKFCIRNIAVFLILITLYNIFFNTLFWIKYDIVPGTYKDVVIEKTANTGDTITINTAYFRYINKNGDEVIHDPNIELKNTEFCDDDCKGHYYGDNYIKSKYISSDKKIIKYKPWYLCNGMLIAYIIIYVIILLMYCEDSFNNNCDVMCPLAEICDMTRTHVIEQVLREKLIFLGYKIEDIDDFIRPTCREKLTVKNFVERLKNKNSNN